jgi:hypothetical protein
MIDDADKIDWYERAAPGSPDKYRVTQGMTFYWQDCPGWVYRLVKCRVGFEDGCVESWADSAGKKTIICKLSAGFFFAVSVAPNFAGALPAAAVHDWFYAHVDTIAAAWGCSSWRVLKLADHWFLANMRKTKFGLRRTYYVAVRTFGFFYNRLGNIF